MSFQQDAETALATIPKPVPGGTSLSPPAALLQREDRGYTSTEHVDKAIRRLEGPSLCCSTCHEDLIQGPVIFAHGAVAGSMVWFCSHKSRNHRLSPRQNSKTLLRFTHTF